MTVYVLPRVHLVPVPMEGFEYNLCLFMNRVQKGYETSVQISVMKRTVKSIDCLQTGKHSVPELMFISGLYT